LIKIGPILAEKIKEDLPEFMGQFKLALNDQKARQEGALFFAEITQVGPTLYALWDQSFTPLCLNLKRDLTKLSTPSGPFLKALGKERKGELAIDGTAGFLKDSLFLYQCGFQVTAIEENPLLYLLAKEAISQAQLPINLYFSSSQKYFAENKINPKIIFLDPMFPPRKKKSLVGKEMQILEKLLGVPVTEDKSFNLLQSALKTKAERVIVKRPKRSEILLGKCKQSFEGKSIRYDLYIPQEWSRS